jgi:hypothetical protein
MSADHHRNIVSALPTMRRSSTRMVSAARLARFMNFNCDPVAFDSL